MSSLGRLGDWGCWLGGLLLLLGSGACERRGPEGGEPRSKLAVAGGPTLDGAAPAGAGSGTAARASENAGAPVAVPPASLVAEPSPPDDGQGLAVVLASKLNLRRVPAAQPQTILATLSCGDIVAIEGRDGDEGAWYKVRADGLKGYSHSAYLAKLGPGAKAPLCQFSFLKGKRKRKAPDPDAPLSPTPHVDKDQAKAVADAPAAPEPTSGPSLAQSGPMDGGGGGRPTASASTTGPAAPAVAAVPAAPAALAVPTIPAASVPAAPPTAPPASSGSRRGPEVIMLAKDSSRARPVEFSHKSHQDKYACHRCHHPVADNDGALRRVTGIDTNMEKRCRSCHTPAGTDRVRATNEDAFHTECRDCHRAVGGHAPSGCRDCHR